MKHIILIALLAISFNSFSQGELPIKDGKVFYESIDSIKCTKAEAYIKAKTWFANTFNSAKSVIQLDDKDAGVIVGKGFTEKEAGNAFTGSIPQNVWYTINITIKDGKYRIQIYDVFLKNTDGYTSTAESINKYPKMNKKFLKRIDDSCKDLIASLKAAMIKPVDNF